MKICIRTDADDQNPIFSHEIYTASVSESAQITVSTATNYYLIARYRFKCKPAGATWRFGLGHTNDTWKPLKAISRNQFLIIKLFERCCFIHLQNKRFNHQGKRIRDKVRIEPAIMAYDQDTGINARLRYSIILGNEGGFFEMNAQTGELFLIREIDLEKLSNPTLSLQIQASQVDNPFRQALARVDISVQDINDNSPEVSFALAKAE